jgi:hypothetical protein
MIIYVFPKFICLENNLQKSFEELNKVIKNTASTKYENNHTIQASSDGCWKCENGKVLRDKNKIRVNRKTLKETTADDSDSIVVDDWIPADGHTGTESDIEYEIVDGCDITLDDIKTHNSNKHSDYGNGYSTYKFNGKDCLILVCNSKLTKPQIQTILDEVLNPHYELEVVEE